MSYTVVKSEPGLWTVGSTETGKWIAASDHDTREEALAYASYYNGGLHPDAVATHMATNEASLQLSKRLIGDDEAPQTILDRIANWHIKAVNASNVRTLDEIRILADSLVVEEFGEYTEALNDNHQTDADEVKELCDLIFVAIFRILALGYDPSAALEAVTKSNESKFFDTEKWRDNDQCVPIVRYCRENPTSTVRPVSETQSGVFNVNTGKLRKGPYYQPPIMDGYQLTNYPFQHGPND